MITPIEIGDIGLAKSVVNIDTDLATQSAELTIRLITQNIGTVDLSDLILSDDVASEYGQFFVDISSAPTVVSTSGGAIAPNVNVGWATDTTQNMFDGTSGFLPPGGQIIVEFQVGLQSPDSIGIDVENQATVTGFDSNGNPVGDLSDSGLSPSTINRFGGFGDPTSTQITFYAYDSFYNFANGFGVRPIVVSHFAPRPVIDTTYTGIVEPGSTLNFSVYDQTGLEIGNRTVVADAAGNWLAHFPNATVHTTDLHYGNRHFGHSFDGISNSGRTEFGARGHRVFDTTPHSFAPHFSARTFTAGTLGHRLYHMPGTEIDGQPHRVEMRQTPAVYNTSLGAGTNFHWSGQRHFQPAVHPTNYFFQASTIDSVFAKAPSNLLKAAHAQNMRPLQFGVDANEIENRTSAVTW